MYVLEQLHGLAAIVVAHAANTTFCCTSDAVVFSSLLSCLVAWWPNFLGITGAMTTIGDGFLARRE
jgi:hypothetical protein